MAINSRFYNGRPACQHCGFCLFFMCEFRSKSTSMVTMLPIAEATGRCEIRPESYVARVETGRDGRATGVSYFDARKRLQLQRAQRGGPVRERRRNAAPAAQLRVIALPERPRQLQRHGRQAPDVQHLLRRERTVRASAERVQERAEHADGARLLRHRSEARLLRRRRHRLPASASTRSPSRSAGCRPDRRRGAKPSRRRARRAVHADDVLRHARHVAAARIEQRGASIRHSRMPGGCRACGSPTRIIPTT